MFKSSPLLEIKEFTELLTGEKWSFANEILTEYTLNYLVTNSQVVRKLVSTNLLKKEIYNIFEMYILKTIQSDIFIPTHIKPPLPSNLSVSTLLDNDTNTPKKIKSDLEKILKNISEIETIYHRNYAGKAITDYFINSFEKDNEDILKGLGKLKFFTERAVRHYTPEQGRTPSIERKARITMIVELMKIFKRFNLSIGTGSTGDFPSYLNYVYEQLKIDVENHSRDLREAREILINNQ